MFATAVRSSLIVMAVLMLSILEGGAALGQEASSWPAESTALDRGVEPVDRSNFDAGRKLPPGRSRPRPSHPLSRRGTSSRFLLGDGFGLRALLEERGLSFYVSSTQFEQGVAAGGLRQAFRWGSKFDMLAHLDSDKLGLWDGGMLDLFTESRLGQSVDGFAGSLSPTNLAMFFPVPDQQITAITGLKFTQAITERSGVFLGKLNALNGDRESS